MKSYILLFNAGKLLHPEWGDYLHLCGAIRCSKLTRAQIMNLFNKLVSDEDYSKDEKTELIDYLVLQAEKDIFDPI